jgi:hypothetical protein
MLQLLVTDPLERLVHPLAYSSTLKEEASDEASEPATTALLLKFCHEILSELYRNMARNIYSNTSPVDIL